MQSTCGSLHLPRWDAIRSARCVGTRSVDGSSPHLIALPPSTSPDYTGSQFETRHTVMDRGGDRPITALQFSHPSQPPQPKYPHELFVSLGGAPPHFRRANDCARNSPRYIRDIFPLRKFLIFMWKLKFCKGSVELRIGVAQMRFICAVNLRAATGRKRCCLRFRNHVVLSIR